MKVAAVVVVYEGLLDSVQVFSDSGKAREKYQELLQEYNLDENGKEKEEDFCSGNDCDVTLEKDLLVY